MDFKDRMEATRKEIDGYLETCLDLDVPARAGIVREAMKYSVLGAGKRLRPVLAVWFARLFGGRSENVFPVAAGIEMIHCYSLVHDDLPAMDNDDYRRGRLSTHKKFGEAMGILTGDALLTHVFWLIAEKTENKALVAPLVSTLAWLAGIGGMVSGQVADIAMENSENPGPEDVRFIHEYKTGALILAACRCGAISAEAPADGLRRAENYGRKAGLAFQIADDILDVEGSPEKAGKALGKDEAKGKVTYPRVFGIEKARAEAASLTKDACAGIADLEGSGDLISLARLMVERDH